jgi:adenosylcobinamide kinase/adenosylcobinamide-phosphate guanylyltransferase
LSKRCVLITGGARSGKSSFAQELAASSNEQVLFVATAVAGDEEMRQRIEQHRRSRPATWSTLEAATDIGRRIESEVGGMPVVVVDCLTLLLNNIFNQYHHQIDEQIDIVEEKVTIEIDKLVASIERTDVSFIIVTNEVGLGVVPANKVSRLYRDLLGKANQMLAACADEVYLMVAGLPLQIKPPSAA